MKYSFTCYGHDNITAKHKTTLEFTKDKDIELEGDCIVGVRADFSLVQLKKFIKSLGNNKKITIIIKTMNNSCNNKNINNIIKDKDDNNKIIEKIRAEINPNFNSDKEMVIRKTDFISERTFATRADKAAFEFSERLVNILKSSESMLTVSIFHSK